MITTSLSPSSVLAPPLTVVQVVALEPLVVSTCPLVPMAVGHSNAPNIILPVAGVRLMLPDPFGTTVIAPLTPL